MLPPGIRQGEQPPYHQIDEYPFQEMCCDLFQNEPDVSSASIYGTRGQSQKGIDLLALRRDGFIEVGQCKRYHQFRASQIVLASDEFLNNWDHWKTKCVKRFILFISCPLDRQEQQEEILRQMERFKVNGIYYEVWHSRVLTIKLGPYPNIVSRYFSPSDYWISYICGTPSLPVANQSGAAVVISEIISNQLTHTLTHLSDHIAMGVQSQFEQMRTDWRCGKRDQVRQWVRELKSDNQIWRVLPAELRARLICFEAGIELDQNTGLSYVKQLALEAESLFSSIEGLRLNSLITYREKGIPEAIRLLEGQIDVDTLNLKAVLLLENKKYDECYQVIENVIHTLVPNAETYRVKSLLNLSVGKLAQARLDAQDALNREPSWYSIQMAAAKIYYFSAISTPALPYVIPLWPEPVAWHHIRRDNESQLYLSKATSLFVLLMESSEMNVEERRCLQAWILACMANNPRLQNEALDYCRSVLDEDPSNIYVTAWAINRSMGVDLTNSLATLETLIADGKARILDIIITLNYYLSNDLGANALELLSKTKNIFSMEGVNDIWVFWKCQSLVVNGNLDEALEIVDLIQDSYYARIAKVTTIQAVASNNGDWGPFIDYFEHCFADSGDSMFLLEYCERKALLEDWAYVADRANELIDYVGTADAVELAALSTYNANRYSECLSLLDKFQHFFTDSILPGNLRRLRVECQQLLGILPRAVSEAEKLVREEPIVLNFLTLAQAYFSLGDLKGVVAVARHIESISDADPKHCLRLTRFVQWNDQDLAVSLWRKAANSPSLQDELIGEVVTLGYQLGLDAEINPFYERMEALGEQAQGGIQKKSFEDLVAFTEQRYEDLNKANELYRNGMIFVHILAEAVGIPLAKIFHTMLRENEDHHCTYGYTPLFCRHGGRPINMEIDIPIPQWRLHMDITAILLAAHLEILGIVEDVFGSIKIPAALIPLLVAMRDKITPHQPSRVKSCRHIHDLIQQSRIKMINPPKVSKSDYSTLIEDIGARWVALWDYARKHNGYFVNFLPLRKRDLSGPPVGLPEDAYHTLINCKAVVDSLRQFGPLSEDEYINALEILGAEGYGADVMVVPRQYKTLVLNTTISETLAETGLIDLICERFEVVIDEGEAKRIEIVLQEHMAGKELSHWLGSIIDRISSGLRNETYEIIPTVELKERNYKENLELDVLHSLLQFKPQTGDIIWIDDRLFTSYRYRDGGIPIIGINEVLDALFKTGNLDQKKYFNLLIKLRATNVRFIPLRAAEIFYNLMQARVQNGIVVETKQLLILRRYVANCLADGISLQRPINGQANPGEIPFVLNLRREIADSLILLWETADTDLEGCQARADWVIQSLYLDYLASASVIGLSLPNDDMYITALGIASLLITSFSLGGLKKQRGIRCRYFAWLDKRLFRNCFAAEPRLNGAVVEVLKRMLTNEQLEVELSTWKYIVQDFYEDLPAIIREELNRDQEFIASIGIRVISIVKIGLFEFESNEFIKAANEAINGHIGVAKLLTPSETEAVIKRDTDSPFSCIVIHADNSQPISLQGDIFELLSEKPGEREAVLCKNRQWFDCTLEQFSKVVAEIATIQDPQRRLDEAERWRKNSIHVYYQHLKEIVHRRGRLARSDFDLPSLDNLCWYFRLPPNTGGGELFQKSLYQAVEDLLKESKLINALERFSALPIPMPINLLEKVQHLAPLERYQLIKALLKSTGSALSKIHLLKILVTCGEERYLRLARRIVVYMLEDLGAAEFDAFKAILDWAESESYIWSSNGVPVHIRLAMVWAHANFLYTAVIGEGASIPWVSEVFNKLLIIPSYELFSRDPNYWYDISHPRQVNRASFLLSGLAYALGDLADKILNPKIQECIVSMAYLRTKEVELPSPYLFRDLTQCQDALGSFLGGDRGETMIFLFGHEKAEILSSKSLQSLLNLAINSVGNDPKNPGAWAIVTNMLSGSIPNEDVVPNLVEILKGVDYVELYHHDAKCGLIALRAATLTVASIHNEELRNYLVQQIREVAVSCSKADATTDEVGISLLEYVLFVSFGQETEEGVINSFVEVTLFIMNAWPQLRMNYRDIFESICQRLSVTTCKPIWKLINLARTY